MATRLGLPGLQPLQDLFTIPLYELPRGTEKAAAEKKCRHWIETALSVSLATAMFFTHIVVSGTILHHHSGYKAEIIDIMSTILFVNVCMRIDDRSTHISMIFYSLFYLAGSLYKQNALGLLFCSYALHKVATKFEHLHTGYLYPSIHRFARSWAPTMARLYGYR